MSISSINSSSSTTMLSGMKGMQRPDPSKLAEQLFSKLDTKGQGYIEKSDLETAFSKVSQTDDSSGSTSSSSVAGDMFSKLDNNGDGKVTREEMSATLQKIAAELDGPFPKMRMQGGQGGTPPPPQDGGEASSTNSSNQASDPADANGDGTVSESELLAYEQSQAASGTKTSSSSSTAITDAQLMQMLSGKMPPQEGGHDDQGFTKDQLTSMSKELSSTDSNRSKVMSDIAGNFDAADTNGDGKVSGSEARTFEESKDASGSTSTSSSASSTDAQFMKQMMQLLHSYGGFDQTAENSSFSASA